MSVTLRQVQIRLLGRRKEIEAQQARLAEVRAAVRSELTRREELTPRREDLRQQLQAVLDRGREESRKLQREMAALARDRRQLKRELADLAAKAEQCRHSAATSPWHDPKLP